MAGCSKITKGGLEFIKQEYSIEPLIHFTEIQKYNVKAKIVGWPIIHSTGTIINHLVNMGVYKRASRFIPKRINDKGKKEVIEISLELQREIAKVFKVTERTVQSAMRFETQSPTARILRAYALNHGAEQYEVTTIKKKVENPYRETIKL